VSDSDTNLSRCPSCGQQMRGTDWTDRLLAKVAALQADNAAMKHDIGRAMQNQVGMLAELAEIKAERDGLLNLIRRSERTISYELRFRDGDRQSKICASLIEMRTVAPERRNGERRGGASELWPLANYRTGTDRRNQP